ncbi:3-hydroxyacyl-CoA dehydrogenase NAD-binding domain-containing protein [Oceanobacillus longus]|uniref:3-hydroxyacyl-CoA dehydrogenase NAD-binding domain-containing protein n=1 Tax=Oceanobacillus longus TaxID=930120 RepID=A0ABV8GZM8_9BACI
MTQLIGIVGSGIMGNGIAQVAATAGYEVVIYDINNKSLKNAEETVDRYLTKDVQKERLSIEVKNDIVNRITYTTEINQLANAYFIIEAVTEKMEVKEKLFSELDKICNPDTYFATNTSGISITGIAGAIDRLDKFIGIHFFNPVPVMELVEITKGHCTSDNTVEAAKKLVADFNKDSIFVEDSPLFVVNRILVPMLSEAIFVLSEGIASKEDIDKGMLLGAKHPIGPLRLADVIGLDTLLLVQETLYFETMDSKYRPPSLLRKMVRAGLLGRKSGEGFYKYG